MFAGRSGWKSVSHGGGIKPPELLERNRITDREGSELPQFSFSGRNETAEVATLRLFFVRVWYLISLAGPFSFYRHVGHSMALQHLKLPLLRLTHDSASGTIYIE
ncbi:hypothetical protein EVAR_92458_1 [Eumeta japonica]|uniref:Uncharacterized protein n=1 Tax=Eumeta variegata TaxID=151549 RepID=A0A4C1T6V5_EUMVA|nr:hypothetical protein EVAR_92458_1 [Eumeta japonica]